MNEYLILLQPCSTHSQSLDHKLRQKDQYVKIGDQSRRYEVSECRQDLQKPGRDRSWHQKEPEDKAASELSFRETSRSTAITTERYLYDS
jgi:hypothetical protein